MNSESNVQKSNIVYRQGGWQAGGRKGRWSINRFQWKGVLPSMSKSIHMVCYLHSCSWSSLSFACSPLATEAIRFKWGHQSQILRHFDYRLSKRALEIFSKITSIQNICSSNSELCLLTPGYWGCQVQMRTPKPNPTSF